MTQLPQSYSFRNTLAKEIPRETNENHLKPWWHHWASTSLETFWTPNTIVCNRSATVIGSCCLLPSTLLFPGFIFSAASLSETGPSDLSVPLHIVRGSLAREGVEAPLVSTDCEDERLVSPNKDPLLCSAAAARSSRWIRRSLASGLSAVPGLSRGLLRLASGADCRLIRNARCSSSSSCSPIAKTKSSTAPILSSLAYRTEEEEEVQTNFPIDLTCIGFASTDLSLLASLCICYPTDKIHSTPSLLLQAHNQREYMHAISYADPVVL